MTAVVAPDASAYSSATMGRSAATPYPFSDATVVDRTHTRPSPIQLRMLATPTRLDGRFEIAAAPDVPDQIRFRFEQALERINILLAEPATMDANALSSRIAADALVLAGEPIATSTANTEIFPLADGGLLFRWRSVGGTAEAEFDVDGDVIVMIEDAVTGTRRAGYAAEMWTEVVSFVRSL